MCSAHPRMRRWCVRVEECRELLVLLNLSSVTRCSAYGDVLQENSAESVECQYGSALDEQCERVCTEPGLEPAFDAGLLAIGLPHVTFLLLKTTMCLLRCSALSEVSKNVPCVTAHATISGNSGCNSRTSCLPNMPARTRLSNRCSEICSSALRQ